MLMILVKECKNPVRIVIHSSPYSIVKKEDDVIYLSNGLNILASFEHGFYFDLFSNSYNISAIDLKDYDTSNIINMSSMFDCCLVNNLNLSNFYSYNVTDMSCMFRGCRNLVELDLSSFDTSKVVNMSEMFGYCISLTRLDLSNFVINNTRLFYDMFYSCSSLKYIKCKRLFKEWCLKNKYIIKLPNSMCEGGDGVWDIID